MYNWYARRLTLAGLGVCVEMRSQLFTVLEYCLFH